jgi:hypothetical protein
LLFFVRDLLHHDDALVHVHITYIQAAYLSMPDTRLSDQPPHRVVWLWRPLNNPGNFINREARLLFLLPLWKRALVETDPPKNSRLRLIRTDAHRERDQGPFPVEKTPIGWKDLHA